MLEIFRKKKLTQRLNALEKELLDIRNIITEEVANNTSFYELSPLLIREVELMSMVDKTTRKLVSIYEKDMSKAINVARNK